MSSIAASLGPILRPIPFPTASTLKDDPAAQAFLVLRVAFTVAPILFGLDKFAEILTDDWARYLSSEFNSILPGSADDARDAHPGAEVVARFGGLGRFSGWDGITLTDSGGFQVFSLQPHVDDDGVVPRR